MTQIFLGGLNFLPVIQTPQLQTRQPEVSSYLKTYNNVLRRPLDWRLVSNCLKELTWPREQQ